LQPAKTFQSEIRLFSLYRFSTCIGFSTWQQKNVKATLQLKTLQSEKLLQLWKTVLVSQSSQLNSQLKPDGEF